jgi:hypothetical protein
MAVPSLVVLPLPLHHHQLLLQDLLQAPTLSSLMEVPSRALQMPAETQSSWAFPLPKLPEDKTGMLEAWHNGRNGSLALDACVNDYD